MKKINVLVVVLLFLQISTSGLAQEFKDCYDFQTKLMKYVKDFQHLDESFHLLQSQSLIDQSFYQFLSDNLLSNECNDQEANFGEVIQQAHDIISGALQDQFLRYLFRRPIYKSERDFIFPSDIYMYVENHKHDIFMKNMIQEWIQTWMLMRNRLDFMSAVELIQGNHIEIIDDLINLKIDLNIKNNNGSTLLHYAVYIGKQSIVDKLVNYGVDLNLKNNQGQTALHFAVYMNYKSMVQLLIDAHADKNIENNRGENALFVAAVVKKNNLIVKLLLPEHYKKVNLELLDSGNNQLEYHNHTNQELASDYQATACCKIS